ncbi:dihydrofolate reductase-like domain-containing protein [Cytidiella melzeri]|nr:dihydrofolate reductase-like domain-containing protein [Cytidiella melzeri]
MSLRIVSTTIPPLRYKVFLVISFRQQSTKVMEGDNHSNAPSTAPPRLLLETLFSAQSDHDGLSLYTGSDTQANLTPESPHASRPHVTLTFAQSIDAKIAGAGGRQLILSGKESMVMTHWMRTMHDAILVGIGTALNDDPQLNTRHLPALPAGTAQRYHLPRPVILDSHLRLSPTCKLLMNYREGRGRRPWVFGSMPTSKVEMSNWNSRKDALERAGARVHSVPSEDGYISLSELLEALKTLGIRSLMVEGGARVIQSFLKETQSCAGGTAIPVVDTVIITVAPIIVGAGGVGYVCDLTAQLAKLHHTKTEAFGCDVVMTFKFKFN